MPKKHREDARSRQECERTRMNELTSTFFFCFDLPDVGQKPRPGIAHIFAECLQRNWLKSSILIIQIILETQVRNQIKCEATR